MADYQQIQEGMSYDAVAVIMRAPGTEISRGGTAGVTMVMYKWKNPRGRGIVTAMFQDDRLTTKSQAGLE
jgi:hypothetical protein